MRRWEGRGRDGEVYEAMWRAQEGWGGVWGDVEGKEGLGWCLGRWGGHMRDGLVYGPMGRSHVVVKLSSYLKLSKIIASKIISYIARIKSWDILPVCVCNGK